MAEQVADGQGERRFRGAPADIARFMARYLVLRLVRRRGGFGTAAVPFGEPLTLRPGTDAEMLGRILMGRIASAVPVLATALAATAALRLPGAGRAAWLAEAARLIDVLQAAGANVVPGAVHPARLAKAFDVMERRGLTGADGAIRQPEMVRFYAASIAHLLPDRGRRVARRPGVPPRA